MNISGSNNNFILRLFCSFLLYLCWFILWFLTYFSIDRLNHDFIENLNPNYPEIIIDIISIIITLSIHFFLYGKKKFALFKNYIKLDLKLLFYILLTVFFFFVLESTIALLFGEKLYMSENSSILYFIDIVVIAPLSEELLYRFLMLNYLLPNNLKNKTSHKIISIVFISIIFSIGHWHFEPWLFTSHFLFSIIITIFYYRTRIFWLVFLIHSISNLIVYFHLYYYVQELNLSLMLIYLLFMSGIISCIYFLRKIILEND